MRTARCWSCDDLIRDEGQVVLVCEDCGGPCAQLNRPEGAACAFAVLLGLALAVGLLIWLF